MPIHRLNTEIYRLNHLLEARNLEVAQMQSAMGEYEDLTKELADVLLKYHRHCLTASKGKIPRYRARVEPIPELPQSYSPDPVPSDTIKEQDNGTYLGASVNDQGHPTLQPPGKYVESPKLYLKEKREVEETSWSMRRLQNSPILSSPDQAKDMPRATSSTLSLKHTEGAPEPSRLRIASINAVHDALTVANTSAHNMNSADTKCEVVKGTCGTVSQGKENLPFHIIGLNCSTKIEQTHLKYEDEEIEHQAPPTGSHSHFEVKKGFDTKGRPKPMDSLGKIALVCA